MTLYYIETDIGCGVRYAYHRQQAISNLTKEVGYGARGVRIATQEDINNVKSMGGHVPKDIRRTKCVQNT